MQLTVPQAIDRPTVLRYLGAAGWDPDAATAALLDRAEALVRQAATPRGVWRALPRAALDGVPIGTDLARHLRCCHSVVLLAATLGAETDALLRRLEVEDIALAAAADATASVLVEQAADALEDALRAALPAGQYLTGRYAPGYGDCPLALNAEVCLALDTVRGMGMAVTDEHLLTPRKSTTAILGRADVPVTGARAGCAHCLLQETCAYRKRGTTCAE